MEDPIDRLVVTWREEWAARKAADRAARAAALARLLAGPADDAGMLQGTPATSARGCDSTGSVAELKEG